MWSYAGLLILPDVLLLHVALPTALALEGRGLQNEQVLSVGHLCHVSTWSMLAYMMLPFHFYYA